jgi:hypothetical protein
MKKRLQRGYTNNTQNYDFDEELQIQDDRITTYQIEVIMDTGATFSMLPGHFHFAWSNLRPCLHVIEGCFKGSSTSDETQIGEFHALLTLNSGETRRVVVPQAIAIHPKVANNYLLATTPFLIAQHRYTCTLPKPTLHFKGGGSYTMSILRGHHIIKLTPINAHEPTPHRTIMLHEPQPYDPPTVQNNATFSTNANRPNASTPTAFIYHLRYGCAGEQVLKRTQPHVIGMNVQLGSWKTLQQKLPCDACLAGKMQKTRKGRSSAFTPVQNLALSWTPATKDKVSTPNVLISTDWGIRKE